MKDLYKRYEKIDLEHNLVNYVIRNTLFVSKTSIKILSDMRRNIVKIVLMRVYSINKSSVASKTSRIKSSVIKSRYDSKTSLNDFFRASKSSIKTLIFNTINSIT